MFLQESCVDLCEEVSLQPSLNCPSIIDTEYSCNAVVRTLTETYLAIRDVTLSSKIQTSFYKFKFEFGFHIFAIQLVSDKPCCHEVRVML